MVQEIKKDPTSVNLNENVLQESVQELQQVRLIDDLSLQCKATIAVAVQVGSVSGGLAVKERASCVMCVMEK